MAGLEHKITVPRRQAMVDEITVEFDEYGMFEHRTGKRDKVLVWPVPTKYGEFVVEYEGGYCGRVKPERLKFLDSKDIFDQYDWSKHD
jgi:hypothetical protein